MKSLGFVCVGLLALVAACDQHQDLGRNVDGGGDGATGGVAATGAGGTPGTGGSGSGGLGPTGTGGRGTGGAGTGGTGTGGAGTGGAGTGGAGTGGAGTGGTAVAGKRVFVTRTEYSGNLGGLTGGDLLCTAAAESAGLVGGPWKAWLSDNTTAAIDRIADVGPWFLTNGVKAFNSRATLATSALTPIAYDEFGRMQPFSNYVWTGTLTGGRSAPAAYNCLNWTAPANPYAGACGDSGGTSTWTQIASLGEPFFCNNTYSIFCFEQ